MFVKIIFPNLLFCKTRINCALFVAAFLAIDCPDRLPSAWLRRFRHFQTQRSARRWQSSGSFRGTTEGVVTWTASSNLSCGAEIIITEPSPNTYSATSGSVSETESGFALSQSGDQLLAYQGSSTSPIFLFGIQFGSGAGWSDATDSGTSAVPSGLTDGVNAINENGATAPAGGGNGIANGLQGNGSVGVIPGGGGGGAARINGARNECESVARSIFGSIYECTRIIGRECKNPY